MWYVSHLFFFTFSGGKKKSPRSSRIVLGGRGGNECIMGDTGHKKIQELVERGEVTEMTMKLRVSELGKLICWSDKLGKLVVQRVKSTLREKIMGPGGGAPG